MTHKPLKHFGQHFLNNPKYLEKILTALNPTQEDLLVEIGAGMGALTKKVLPYCTKLHVVEIDKRFIEYLTSHFDPKKLIVHNANALKFDFATLQKTKQSLRVFGNLPYNISTPLLFHLLTFKDIISDMLFLLQSEVVHRIVAQPGNKTYGRLSVMAQYHCQAQALFDVPPKAFNPPPKVNSSVVKLIPHPVIKEPTINYALFEKVVNVAFQQRRKIIRNSLHSLVQESVLINIGIDPMLRPERLSVLDYVKISNAIAKQN